MLQDIMYLRSLKAARSAKNFWEEIFMPKSQLGGILYIFHLDLGGGGCLYFPLKHKSAMYTFVQQRGGGSEGTQITKVCTNVHTCMYICHLAPPPPATVSTCVLSVFENVGRYHPPPLVSDS